MTGVVDGGAGIGTDGEVVGDDDGIVFDPVDDDDGDEVGDEAGVVAAPCAVEAPVVVPVGAADASAVATAALLSFFLPETSPGFMQPAASRVRAIPNTPLRLRMYSHPMFAFEDRADPFGIGAPTLLWQRTFHAPSRILLHGREYT